MLSIVAEEREEMARRTRPKITPPTPETVDSLRSLAGPLGDRPDPLVQGYADSRPSMRGAPTIQFNDPAVAEHNRLREIDYGSPGQVGNPLKAFFTQQDPFLQGVVQPAAGRLGRKIGENIRINPTGAGLGGGLGVTTPEQRKQLGSAGAFVAEGVVPTRPVEVTAEVLPGVGDIRGVASLARKSLPELRVAFAEGLARAGGRVEEFAASPEGRALIERARLLHVNEFGGEKLPGVGPENIEPKPGAGEPSGISGELDQARAELEDIKAQIAKRESFLGNKRQGDAEWESLQARRISREKVIKYYEKQAGYVNPVTAKRREMGAAKQERELDAKIAAAEARLRVAKTPNEQAFRQKELDALRVQGDVGAAGRGQPDRTLQVNRADDATLSQSRMVEPGAEGAAGGMPASAAGTPPPEPPQRALGEAVPPEAPVRAEPAAQGAGAPPEPPVRPVAAAEPPDPDGSLPEVFRTGKPKVQTFDYFRDEQGNLIPVSKAAPPIPPEALPIEAGPARGPFAGEAPTPQITDTSLFRTETGAPIDIESHPETFPGGQPVVQGVGEGTAGKPPYIGGRDRIGDVLDRAEQQRIETFEARAQELGAPPEVVKVLAQAYRDGQTFAATARRYADSSPVMQQLGKAKAWVEGNVPDGVVNSIARAHLVGANGVRLYVDEQLPRFKGLNKLIDAAPLRFVGPAKMRALAEEFPRNSLITHPDWWRGVTPELRAKIAELQPFQNDLYKIVQAIDPNAAPALDAPYLRTMWNVPESGLTSAVSMPVGRAGVTKKRTFPDPFEAMASGSWPYKLKTDDVEELIASSSHLAARQIGVQLERKMILDRFGSTMRRPGLTRFRNPNYAGWYAKPEIVNFIDQLHEPAGSMTRQVGNVTGPIRNMIFGVGDVGVFGQHVLNLLSTRGPVTLMGAINRGLERMGAGADLYRYLEADIPRASQRVLDGMPAKGSQAGRIGDPHAKTPLGLIPKAGPKIDGAVDALNDFQFNGVLAPLRDMTYEGNLLVKKLLGIDISNPAVRRQAAENANAFSGASLGALRMARKQGESSLLGAPSITRSMAAELAQVAKLNTPEAWTTLASIGAVVYGMGSLINMRYGSGEPVPLDPRSPDWAIVHLGGSWQMVNGEKKYVGGRKIRMIPQASLVRAIGKSMTAVQEGDPEKFTKAWAQFAFGRSTPLVQDAITLPTGIGFTDEGYFSPNLPFTQRLKNVAPVPISARGLLKGETSPAELALSEFGASSFPGETVKDVERGQRTEARKKIEASGYNAIGSDIWKELQADGSAPKEYGSPSEMRNALIGEVLAEIEKETPDADPIQARVLAERVAGNVGVFKLYDKLSRSARESFLKAHPDIAQYLVEQGDRSAANVQDILTGATP